MLIPQAMDGEEMCRQFPRKTGLERLIHPALQQSYLSRSSIKCQQFPKKGPGPDYVIQCGLSAGVLCLSQSA